jgi:hypothetical protein
MPLWSVGMTNYSQPMWIIHCLLSLWIARLCEFSWKQSISKLVCVLHIQCYTWNMCFLPREFPSCDFEEYNYGPKSHWLYEYEFAEFQAGIKPWPCTKMSGRKCKCGIKACGVVPSELGYGYYCGNAYGGLSELWVSWLNRWSYYMNISHQFVCSLLLYLLRWGGHAIGRTSLVVES